MAMESLGILEELLDSNNGRYVNMLRAYPGGTLQPVTVHKA